MKSKFREQEVTIKGEFDLGATVTIPDNGASKYPAIVIIGGTGKGDRNGNMKKFEMNIYRQLAEFLTGLGFVTIRYDKRGIAQSKGDHNRTGVADLIQDIISNVQFLESLPYVDPNKILLLGHSEGCILATIVNTKRPVAGLILLAGAGVSLKTAIQSQNLALAEEIKLLKGFKGKILRLIISEKKAAAKQNKLFAKVQNSAHDVIRMQGLKIPAKWLREHLSYSDRDVQAMLNNSTCPILALTGDKDVQADAQDLGKINALLKDNISCGVIKDMDHILKEYKGQKSIMNIKKQYKNECAKSLHKELQEQIKTWCEINF